MCKIAAFVFSLISAKWKNRRYLIMMVALVISIVGTTAVYALPRSNPGG